MKYYICFFLVLILYSCGGYRTTKFTLHSLNIGESLCVIIDKYKKPFKTETHYEMDVRIDNLYYKEVVDVSSYTYILTTVLTFKNLKLIDIKQIDEYIPDVDIRNLEIDVTR